jgi:hypothetical protein
VIDQLAYEYSNQHVVVVDYHFSIDVPPLFDPPQARWDVIQLSVPPGTPLGLTWAVVDSGRLYHRGAETTEEAYNTYTAMIDDALTQPATAEVNAYWWRDGNTIKIRAEVANNSTITLSTGNNAGVYGIVKENGVRYDTHTTQHPGLNAAKTAISSLSPGQTDFYTIEVPDINPTDWEKVEVIVLVDYQTAPEGHYEQLQAAIANQALYAQPSFHAFLLDDGQTFVPAFTSTVLGNVVLSWNALSDQTWLELDATSGLVGDTVVMTTDGAALVPGWNTALVTFTDSSGVYSYDVTVSIYKASPGEFINRIYLPVITQP